MQMRPDTASLRTVCSAVDSIAVCCLCADLLTVRRAAAQMHCVLFEVHADDLVDPAVQEHVLLIVVNHVCTDGWSEKVCTLQSCCKSQGPDSWEALHQAHAPV